MKSRVTLVIVTAAISVALTSAVWIAVLAIAYRYYLTDPPPFAVSVDAPHAVNLGETITVKAQVLNPTDEHLNLGSIDIYDSLLDGFTVVEIEPEPARRDHVLDFSTFYYSKTLAPGETLAFSFKLTATRAGTWTGDVDFCTPAEKFVTSSVTMRVIDGPESAASRTNPPRLEMNSTPSETDSSR